MHYTALMAIIDSRDELHEDPCCLWLLHASIGHQMIEDLSIWCILCNQIDHRLRFHYLVEACDVRMTQRFQYRYLAESLAQIFLVQACFIDDLDGHLQEEEEQEEANDEEQEAEGRISQSIDECSFKSPHTQRIFGCGCEFVVFGFGPEGERTNRVQRRETGERKAKGTCTTRHERAREREREVRRDRLKLCGLTTMSCSVASPRNESK